MAAQTATELRTSDDYTIGWVCALPKEQTAATAMLDEIHADLPTKPPNDTNAYTLGSIGKHNIVIACLPKGKLGTSSAATVAIQMVRTFPSIKIGLMVGIGGGIPHKVRLGDVVVSTPVGQFPGVVQWDFGKAKHHGKFERTGALNNPPTSLLTALTKLETQHEMNGSKMYQYLDDLERNWPNLVPKYIRSTSLNEPFLELDNSYRGRHRWQVIFLTLWETILAFLKFLLGWWAIASVDGEAEQVTSTTVGTAVDGKQSRPRDIRVHYGLIASGNQVIKDAKLRDSLNESLGGNVLCVEMEAAGLMDNFPCVVIRGICDYADSHKNKDWQEHAAAVAAAFGKELLGYVQPSDVDGERPVKDILSEVLDTVSKTEANVETMRSRLDRKEDLEILNWLTDIDYGPQQTDYITRRQAGTGQWLLSSADFKAWMQSNNQTLFCPGIPGAGKTILTSIVVNDLISRFHMNSMTGIAYIYFNFNRQEKQKVGDLLASLLKQLAESLPSLPGSVKDIYTHHETKRTRPSLDEISRVLGSVAAIYSRVFFIIDALDECQASDGCRASFLSELFNLQTRHGANIFATSRFIPEIIDQFKGGVSLEIRASTDDVERYLEGHIMQLPIFVQQNRPLQEEIKKGISEAVDGMFLLAQIYLGLLDDKLTINDIRNTLEVFRKQGRGSGEDQKVQVLAFAYEQAVERINGQKPGLKKLAMKVLLWIACANRQLTASELQHALATKVGKSKLDQGDLPHIGDMVSVCLGLVTIDEESNIIRLVHYTTQEYFRRTRKRWFPKAESEITTICVTYLLFTIFESGFCETDKAFEGRLWSNPLYDYASHNWGHHARAVLAEVEQLRQLVLKLLESEHKVSGCSQAMMASGSYPGYSQRVPEQMTGLHLVAYFGVDKAVQFLISSDSPDPEDSYGRTPLSWAAENGHEAVVKLLLDKGAEPETKDTEYGQTPLSWAAENGHEAVVKLLLDKGAEPETKDTWYGQTPLLWAAGKGHEAVVKLLLDKGAEPESKASSGRTPLSWAAENGHEAVVKLLLDKGAEPETKDTAGRTPLSWAAEKGCEAVVKLLLEKGAKKP
ncbi:related to nucleoside phosphorylase [Phialocephala subalpina]|uniref:Related to nucleoside phosphorylase n=1 Tax=Phialocephala subalpina TaxID=576137 RepID=A0A1L7XJW1_9HELO|nr:related to nucleoside phosphorylase [Phialocephala subalpina]